ncbi:MAG TPA: N-acetylmuramic acid 6-phosphate etherase [Myxococcaceae bacterium]|nr:N-acetylmuramic acid 6-phosphate etherase [Myxococcaceae bacterium]
MARSKSAQRARSLPPTERIHPASLELDRLSAREIVQRLHDEDEAAVRAVARAVPQIARAAEAARDALAAGGRIVYVGAGTSGRLGVLDAAECPPTFGARPDQVIALIAGGLPALHRAVEGAEDDARDGAQQIRRARVRARDLVIGISASASTPYVLGALRQARQARARTALISCTPSARDRTVAEIVIALDTGPELIAGSTRLKAGTATKLALNAISTAAFVRLGKVYRGRMVDLRPTNAKLRARAHRIVTELTGLPDREARTLLVRARGSPRLAVAMHLTGLAPRGAARALAECGLRGLEPPR